MSKVENPADGNGGASELDHAGSLIGSENIESAEKIKRRKRGGRASRRGSVAATEAQIQRAVFAHLQKRGVPGLVAFHPANGGFRRPTEAAILKGLGVRAGVPDIIALCNGRAFALELKTEGGKPTAEQMRFVSHWVAAGGSAAIAHGLDQALRLLEIWGLLRGHVS